MNPQRGRLWALVIDNSLLLAAGAAAGLGWANIDHLTYERFSQVLRFAVNDVGMVFFFALAVKEIIEATLPGGPLESPREALVPILAAAGGMLDEAKMGALMSFLAAPIAIVMGRQLGTMSKTPRDSVSTRPSTPATRDR